MSRYLRNEEALAAAVRDYTKRRYTVGLDLGQTADPTAIAVIERVKVPILSVGRIPDPIPYETSYIVRWLERFPLRMSYPQVVDRVQVLLSSAPIRGNCTLVIDHNGVGRPVFDMFRKVKLCPVGITITAGDGYSIDQGTWRVSKLLLISRLEASLHSRLLHIVPTLPEAEVLKSELADFRRNVTATGYTQFSARSGRHDDLVLAVAIGLWYSAHRDGQVISVGDLLWY
jgi:hypothetical protein